MRTAYPVDSVPELVNRNMSSPKRVLNCSATSVETGDGVTNRVPMSSRDSLTLATTVGLRWPTSIAPKPIDRSSTWRSSQSVTYAPRADFTPIGYGSQYWKLLVTPSGKVFDDRAAWSAEPGVVLAYRSHSLAMSAETREWSNGVKEPGSCRQPAGSWAGNVVDTSVFGLIEITFNQSECPSRRQPSPPAPLRPRNTQRSSLGFGHVIIAMGFRI